MIALENIDVSFSGKKLFSGFSAQIERGKHTSFSGGSGKGKSTLLKILQGYIIPQSGRVAIDGEAITTENINQIRSRIAWIPQNVNLPVNNCMELMQLMEVEHSLDRVQQNIEHLGLPQELISKDFSEVSGGEKQRLVIAVCYSQNKDIVLLDEPTSSLDAASTDKLINLLKSEDGRTIISASHNPEWLKSTGKVIEL